jgi:hypothetical protein
LRSEYSEKGPNATEKLSQFAQAIRHEPIPLDGSKTGDAQAIGPAGMVVIGT